MRFSSVAAVAALFTAAVAAPANVERHVLHEKRAESDIWVKGDRIHSGMKLPMRFGLNQGNVDQSHDLLMEVADPESPKYGQHYSAEEVIDLFAPHPDSAQAVRSWLERAGVEAHRISESINKQWMAVDLEAWEAEALLNTKYHFFEHAPTGKMTIGCDQYHVNEHVSNHIDYVTPGINLIATRKPKAEELEKRTFGWGKKGSHPPLLKPLSLPLASILAAPALALCDTVITPDCIMAMYNYTAATSAVPGNQLGIFEDLGDYYDQTDLNEFFLVLQSRIPQGTHPTLEGVDGGTAPTNVAQSGAESNLDFQISYPIIWPQNSILFQTDDPVYEANYTFDGFLDNFLYAIDGSYCNVPEKASDKALDPPYPDPAAGGYKKTKMCGVYKPTNQISISYGGQEYGFSYSYQKRQCLEYLKLGLQGVTVLVASGDSGVSGPTATGDNGCINQKAFNPDFPASCPYLTAVGATLLTGDAKSDQETAVTRFGSGGGFSNIYPRPAYQNAAVSTYFAQHNPPYPYYSGSSMGAGLYNRSGRGYPDVSAVGDNIIIFTMGAPTLIGGTSASCPVWGGIITRINNERIKAGKKTVGFINPTLYKNPSAMHDITVGNNPGCGTNGFSASTGWDPVTGLGTPNYPALLKVFMALK